MERAKPKKFVRITLSVDPDDYAAFEEISKDNDFSAAWLVRRAMREFLEKYQDGGSLKVRLGGLSK